MFQARRIEKMHPSVVNALVKLLKALGRELFLGKDVEISSVEKSHLDAKEWSRKGLRLVKSEHDSIVIEPEAPKSVAKKAVPKDKDTTPE